MSYQIVRGWPSAGALDEPMKAAAGQEVVGGSIVSLDANGEAVVATFAADGSDAGNLAFFCIDTDPLAGSLVGLTGDLIIECDVAHFDEAGAYAPNVGLTAVDGKFAVAAGTQKVVGTVRSYDATNQKLRLVWAA